MTNTKAILASIDNVNDTVMEADLSVINAMASSYEKASFIMENYTGDEQNMFSIFQEDMKDWLAKKDDESIITQIVKFLPRMIYKLLNFIKSAWSGNVVKESKSVLDKASDAFDKVKGTIGKLANVDENWFEQNKKKIAIIGGGVGAAGLAVFTVFNRKKITSSVTNFVNKLENIIPDIKQKRKNRKIIFEITIAGDVRTNVGFKKILRLFQGIPKYFAYMKDMKKKRYTDAKKYIMDLEKMYKDITEDLLTNTDIVSDEVVTIDVGEFSNTFADMINTMETVSTDQYDGVSVVIDENDPLFKELNQMPEKDKNEFESINKKLMDIASQDIKMVQLLFNDIKNDGVTKGLVEVAQKLQKADLSKMDELTRLVNTLNNVIDSKRESTVQTDDSASDSANENTSTTSSSTDNKTTSGNSTNSDNKGSNDHVGESWYSM